MPAKYFLVMVLVAGLLCGLFLACGSSDDDDDDDNDDDDDGLEPYCENGECLIPGQDFSMGCNQGDSDCLPDETPAHQVLLAPYFIDRFEVTNDDYVAYLNAENIGNDCDGIDCIQSAHLHNSLGIYFEGDTWQVDDGYGDRPVTLITWYGAIDFCEAQGKSLPTEAQWELAAKGASQSYIYPWGGSWIDNAANFKSNADPYETGAHPWTTPVGYFDGTDHDKEYATTNGQSPFALFDMAGNAEEWVGDWYDDNYYSENPDDGWNDPAGPSDGEFRGLRGGSWGDVSVALRTSRRNALDPEGFSVTIGFRCAHPYEN